MASITIRWFVGMALGCLVLAQGVLAQDRGEPTPSNGRRVALVIGNADYKSAPLRNPVNDATDVAAKLKALDFEVIVRTNLTSKQIGGALREFKSKLSPGAVALFFYAGHGVQIKGENYLPAVDADIGSEEDVPNQSLSTRQIMGVLEDSKTRLNLVFLDACRDNPFARSFRSASGGLAKLDAPSGTLISFATRPGSVAADGSGKNGLYTENLLKVMDVPNMPIEQALKQVVSSVKKGSNGKQEPWMEGSIEGDFYFVRSHEGTTPAQQKTSSAAAALDAETAVWNEVKASGSKDYLNGYLAQYPKGKYAFLARIEIKKLEELDKARAAQGSKETVLAQAGISKPDPKWRSLIYSTSEDQPVAQYLQQHPNWIAELTALANKGDPDAQGSLARMYSNGWGVAKDRAVSLNWAKKAAEQGNAMGQNALGSAYEEGVVVKRDYAEAFKWRKLAAQQGYAVAQSSVGWTYFNGKGVPKDEVEAVKWFRLAISQGNESAQRGLGEALVYGRGLPKDESKGLELFQKLADAGSKGAQSELGDYYRRKSQPEQAIKWFRMAAAQGAAWAESSLGWMYFDGVGVTKDEVEAVKWFRLAASQGHEGGEQGLAKAQLYGRGLPVNVDEGLALLHKSADVGNMYSQAELGDYFLRVAKNADEALKWLKLAADQGNGWAQSNLGWAYRDGNGVAKNPALALQYFQAGALSQDRGALQGLGLAYLYGQGVAKDAEKGISYLTQSANLGSPWAMVNIGNAYQRGDAGSKNDAEALKWFRRAAELKNKEAQKRVAEAYLYGRGVDKDEAEANKWFRLVAQ